MDLFCQELADINQEIKDILQEKIRLQKKKNLGCITEEENIELDSILERLVSLRTAAKRCNAYIKLAIKYEEPASKSFSEANSLWIQAVTGVNVTYRKWTDYVIDETVYPGPEFKTAFVNISKAFHQQYEAGRCNYLNLILSDILLRPEFEGILRIFPDVELTAVQTNDPKKRKLTGKMDYAIGFAKGSDMFDDSFPCKVHVVAVQAKENEDEDDWKLCVAQAASLHKNRVDAYKANTNVWGILSNATNWRFFFIDESSYLWQSDEFFLNLQLYDESKVLHVYQLVHYIVKCCYETNTTPSSSDSSASSIGDFEEVFLQLIENLE